MRIKLTHECITSLGWAELSWSLLGNIKDEQEFQIKIARRCETPLSAIYPQIYLCSVASRCTSIEHAVNWVIFQWKWLSKCFAVSKRGFFLISRLSPMFFAKRTWTFHRPTQHTKFFAFELRMGITKRVNIIIIVEWIFISFPKFQISFWNQRLGIEYFDLDLFIHHLFWHSIQLMHIFIEKLIYRMEWLSLKAKWKCFEIEDDIDNRMCNRKYPSVIKISRILLPFNLNIHSNFKRKCWKKK